MKALELPKADRDYCLSINNDKSIIQKYDEAIKELEALATTAQSKFKVGDWVENSKSSLRIIKQVTAVAEGCDTVTVGDKKVGINVMLITDLKLWKPKPGEWCWFWSKSFPKPQLLPFRSYFRNSFYSTECGVTIFNGVLCECNYFDYCEPFIGQLPTFIKDQS